MTLFVMTEQAIEKRRKALIFRSWHRGTREMDLIMGSFADAHVPVFSDGDLDMYEALLLESDPDLYNWYAGKEDPPANVRSDVLEKFLKHKVVKDNF